MSDPDALQPVAGWVAPAVGSELPGLRLLSVCVDLHHGVRLDGDSPRHVLDRLRDLSNRVRGARAITIRREPVTAAYRVFYRHIGFDPEVQRTPAEAAVLERMLRGGFPTAGWLEDVVTITLVDTGVPVWALDASGLRGELGVRLSEQGEGLGRAASAVPLAAGTLVVADQEAAAAVLFGPRAPELLPRGACEHLTLYALQVPGVPELYVEEALWSCATALQNP